MGTIQKKIFSTVFASCLFLFALAQQRTVTGIVKSGQGVPLDGATFAIKGTSMAGLTKKDGSFSVKVTGDLSVLTISYVGYQTADFAVGKKTSMSITLNDNSSSTALNEVVVTGFGETRAKRNLGYSATQVKGDDIRKASAVNPIAALQGMVPGLQVSPGIGGPQSTTKFLIRGSASLDPYGNTPLIVIDDIVMDQDVVLPNRGGDQDFGNILKDLNPDDIESMTVLKGGAVTALYGSRASNGVILIKTKKGFSQKGLGVSLTQSMLFDKAYKTIDFQNQFGSGLGADDWTIGPGGELQVDQNWYGLSFGPEMKGQTFRDINGELRTNDANENYILDLYQTGVTSNTNVSVSGGNEKNTFRLSYSRLGSKAITPGNNFDRNSLSLRTTHRLAQRVLLNASVNYTTSTTLNPALQGGSSLIYNYAYVSPRNYDTKYWQKNYIAPEGGLNRKDPNGANEAFWKIYENKYTQKEYNFRGDLNLQADLTKWLRFEAVGAINSLQRDNENKTRGQGVGFAGGGYSTGLSQSLSNRFRGNFNLTKKLNKFDLFFQGGAETYGSQGKSQSAYTNGFILPDLFRLSNSVNPVSASEGASNRSQTSALFFQGSSYYSNFLTLNVYGRNDWNSTLVYNDGHGNYSYFYPGADVAFIFTDAFKLPKAIDFGKLRVSYVQAGGGTNPYTANTGSYSNYGAYRDAYGNSVSQYGYGSNTLPNQDLVPVRNVKMEAGVEFKMFGNRLGGDFTVYQQDSKNQIINFGVPAESGVTGALINGGKVRNKGIELMLYGTPVKSGKFSWDAMFNYTRNRNTIQSLPFGLTQIGLDGADGISSVAQLNGDYGTIIAPYGQASYQAQDANGKNISSPLNGMPVVSFNTSGITGQPMTIYRRASNYNPTVGGEANPVVGSALPKFLGSLRNTFNYGNLSLNVFLDSKFGGDVYSSSLFYGTQNGNIKNSLFGRTAELGGLTYTDQQGNKKDDGMLPEGVYRPGSIAPANQSADGQSHNLSGMTVADAYAKGYIKPTAAADYYLYGYGWGNGIRTFGMVESSWVAVREVSVSYQFPQKVISKLKLNGLRANVIIRNLGYLYNSAANGLNPDNMNSTSSGGFLENGGVPFVRTFGCSLDASF